MWTLKAHYLFWFGSLSGILPYVSIFARKHLGVSSQSVGILYCILPFVVSIAKPVICSVADHYQQYGSALLCAQLCMIIGYGLLLLIPVLIQWINANILWWVFCLLALLANTSMGAGISLTDYLVINEVTRAKQLGNENINYGHYRIWGTIGFGVFGILSGAINKLQNLPYLIPGLIMFVGIEILDIFCIYRFYKQNTKPTFNEPKSIQISHEDDSNVNENNRDQSTKHFTGIRSGLESITMAIGQVFRIFRYYPSLIQLSFIVFCFGILTVFHWSFFFWFIEDLRGKDSLLMGLCILVESFIGEIPIFYVAHHIIQRFGPVLSLCISLGAFAIRYLAYGYWLAKDNGLYWDILLVEALQGLTFSLFYTVMTHVGQYYADKYERIERIDSDNRKKIGIKPSATMQGLLSACYEGIGLGTGSLIGGYVIESYGILFLWRLGAFLSIALIVFNLCIEFIKYCYHQLQRN